jgi:adenosine deaminase
MAPEKPKPGREHAPQTELHRHLDVSTRLTTLLELAKEQGIEQQSTSLEAFRRKLVLQEPLKDLASVLDKFALYQKVLTRPAILERIAFEGVEDCWNEGTRKVEFRYSPSFVSEYNGLSWEEAQQALLAGLKRGLQEYPEMQAGLLCIASRDFGPDEVNRTVEFFLNHMDTFLGLDLAGKEDGFPCHLFETSFKKAIQKGARITVHAGEALGPESIWEAIELLGAQRIGHGIACIEDPQLMEYLKKHSICLEQCPTSNWLTNGVTSFEEHPLPRLLRAGLPVCINTDDPSIFGTTLPQEIRICVEKMGMTLGEVEKCHENASTASFLNLRK